MIEQQRVPDIVVSAAPPTDGPADGAAPGAPVLEDGARLELRALIPLEILGPAGALAEPADVVALDGLAGPLELPAPAAAIPTRREPRLKRPLDLALAAAMLVG